ncbi:hypothetical protein [Actinocorallia libanotica]|uniref:Uncharacterized protein n=1 Tax=Actinocorallia libanotica TaxID=46162 RepID=A0ABN1Q4R7_9ACTN
MSASPQPTPRMKRGMRLCEQEAALRRRGPGPGRREQPETVRAALDRISVERERLLAQIEAELLPLRARQAEYDRARAASKAPPRLKRIQVSKAEQRLRRRMAALQRERAYVDGTVYRDRESAGR